MNSCGEIRNSYYIGKRAPFSKKLLWLYPEEDKFDVRIFRDGEWTSFSADIINRIINESKEYINDTASKLIEEGIDYDLLVELLQFKTINGLSITGEGDISFDYSDLLNKPDLSQKQDKLIWDNAPKRDSDNAVSSGVLWEILNDLDGDIENCQLDILALEQGILEVQPLLISGTNIKTINGLSVLGSGNILIESSSGISQIQSDWDLTNESSVDYIKNKPTIPKYIRDLTEDEDHQTVSQTQTNYWNNKSNFSGSYNDLSDKPTIPSLQGYATEAWVGQQGFLTQHQDISGKEDKSNKVTTITDNESSNTYYPTTKAVADYAEKRMEIVPASGTTLSAVVNTYYNFASEVGTLDITFPVVTDTTHISNIVFMLTTGTSPSVTFTAPSGVNVIAQDGFSIEANTTYEINAIFNGSMWIVAAIKLDTTDIQPSNP